MSRIRVRHCIAGALMVLTTSAAQAQQRVLGADLTAAGFPGTQTIPQAQWCNEYPSSPPTCPDTMFGGCSVTKDCATAISKHFETPGDASLLSAVDAACLREDECSQSATRLSGVIAARKERIARFRCGEDEDALRALVSTDPILANGACRDQLSPQFRTLAAQRCEVLSKLDQCRWPPPPPPYERCAVNASQADNLAKRENALCAWTSSETGGITAYLAECPRIANGEDEAQCLSPPLMMERLQRGVCTQRAAAALSGPALVSEPLDLVMAAPPDVPRDDACLFGRALEGTACGPAASGVRVGHAAYYERIRAGAPGQIAAFFPHRDDPGKLSVIRFTPTASGKDFPATLSPAGARLFFGEAAMLCSNDPQERLTAQAYQLRRMAAASDTGPLPVATLPAPVAREEPLSMGDCGWQETDGLLCWRHSGVQGEAREALTTWRPMAAATASGLAEAVAVAAVLRERLRAVDGEIYVAARNGERVLTWATGGAGFAAHALSPLRPLTKTAGKLDEAWLTRQLEDDDAPTDAVARLRWWLGRAPLTAAARVPDEGRVCWLQGAPGPAARLQCGTYGSDEGITQPLLALPPEHRRTVIELVGQPAAQPFFERLAGLPGDCLMRWLAPDEDAPDDILRSAFLLECGAGLERFWMSVTSEATTALTLSDPGAMALLADPAFAAEQQADAHRAGATRLRLHSPALGAPAAAATVLSARIGRCTKVRETGLRENAWIDLGELLAPDLTVIGGIPGENRAERALACLDTPAPECNDILLSWIPFLRQDVPANVSTGLACDG